MQLKELYNKNKLAVWGAGMIVAVILIWLTVAWFSASSEISVPKAERYEASANVSQQQATVSEAEANTIRDQRTVAHEDTLRSKETTKQRKARYDKARNSNTGVSDANLDIRERELRTGLEELYPTPKR